MTLTPIRLLVIRTVEEYCAEFSVSADALGRLSLGDPKIVPRLRTGKNVTLHRIEGLLAFIDGERAMNAIARQVTGQSA